MDSAEMSSKNMQSQSNLMQYYIEKLEKYNVNFI